MWSNSTFFLFLFFMSFLWKMLGIDLAMDIPEWSYLDPPPPHPHSTHTHTQTHPQGVVIPYNEHSHLPGSLPDMLISDLQNIAVFILWLEWEAVLMFFSTSTCLWTVGSSFLIVVLFRWKWQCVFFPCKTEALMKDEWFSCWHKRFPTCGMTLVQHGSFDFLLFCLEGSFNVT